MPTARDHIPAGPTQFARRLDALEREVRELRAARRAAHTALSTGGIQLVDAAGDVLAEAIADFHGQSAFVAYDTRGGDEYYASLAAGNVSFGLNGVTEVQDEARIAYNRISETDIYELLLSSGNAPGLSRAQINMYSESAPSAGDRLIDVLADKVDILGLLTARNISFGSIVITPSAANTPTTAAVTGLTLPGTTFIGVATAATAVPGTSVTGVGVTGVTSTGMNVWVSRTNTTNTTVYWMVMSK
ncbi:hypothetical protein [Streptomyces sp. NPDC006638]|uniref:hypothetical protein n=1 Tax=Streptomyces sp. NPDC006638 TaxID=3157183 RepID=UPI0033BF97D5